MDIIHSLAALRERLHHESNISFVPTMGNLHAGHIALAKIAKSEASCTVVSIFVNPLQFGKNEDLSNYPRTLEEDYDALKSVGVDVVFAPSVIEMYPDYDAASHDLGQSMTITPPPIANTLCGATRPGHFVGVATVVMKLFHMVQPHVAIFGKKDFQQLTIIREMVKQFNLPIRILAGETVREKDGLALSSRNGYLSPAQRTEAPRLNKALSLVVDALKSGNKDFASVEVQTTQYLTQMGWIVDYIKICNAKTLMSAHFEDKTLIVLGAAKLGSTRLIDNIEFSLA